MKDSLINARKQEEEEIMTKNTNQESGLLEKNNSKKQSESKKAMNGIQAGIAFAILSGLCAYLIYGFYEMVIGRILFWFLVLFMVLCCLVSVSCIFDWKTAKKIEKLEAAAREEEKEFLEIDPSKRALRAEKMFKMNQKELMRYYDMNLAQTKFLSGLGIMMIIFGILIVIASIIMYVYMDSDKILLVVGNVSGIIVDFVGAIFIKMYTQNVEAAVRFHAKFAESNNLLLANSIANKIENPELRETTLSEIAKDIITSNRNGKE